MVPAQPCRAGVGRVVVVSSLTLLATLLGGWRVAVLTAARPDPMTLRVGTSSFTVTHVERVAGLTDSELGGMSHGIQSLVSDDKALIRVSVVVSAGRAATDYDTSTLRAVGPGTSGGVAPLGGSLGRGHLAAHGRLEGSLSFVVPRNGAELSLRAGSLPREVPLLQVDEAPAGAGRHTH